jgi:hypothetical protein
MEGKGEYQPNLNNAHGNPDFSADVYIKEIIDNKKDKNDLKNHRPNCLMVNGLGVDFQNLFISNRVKNLNYEDEVIDSLILNACGIDEKLVDCPRRLYIKNELTHEETKQACGILQAPYGITLEQMDEAIKKRGGSL